MFLNPAAITPNTPASAKLSNTDTINPDQRLAETHRDMAAQAINPSALRKAHDDVAVDYHVRLPVSQLSEYLLKPEALNVKGQSDKHVAALEALNKTVKSAYEKSPSFRRLFNHAWDSRLRDHQARYSLAAGDGSPQPSASELKLPDVLKRGPKPRYDSAAGMSSEQAFG